MGNDVRLCCAPWGSSNGGSVFSLLIGDGGMRGDAVYALAASDTKPGVCPLELSVYAGEDSGLSWWCFRLTSIVRFLPTGEYCGVTNCGVANWLMLSSECLLMPAVVVAAVLMLSRLWDCDL